MSINNCLFSPTSENLLRTVRTSCSCFANFQFDAYMQTNATTHSPAFALITRKKETSIHIRNSYSILMAVYQIIDIVN